MKQIPVKPTRRSDWANYIDPKEQARVKNERHYKISSALDLVVDGKGRAALVFHNGLNYMGDTILSESAKGKLAYILMKVSGRGGK